MITITLPPPAIIAPATTLVDSTLEFRREARRALSGHYVHGTRGRTDRLTGVTWSTPVEVVAGSNQPPKLVGLPYWKTCFSRGGFQKVLYTPSTLTIEVGEHWKVPATVA